MKVLFISSGNSGKIGAIVEAQADSLRGNGITVEQFPVLGKGILGYLKNISLLRKHLKTGKYDIIHAHYSYCGFIASLAGAKNTVVSLMGSDVIENKISAKLIKFFNHFFWKAIIVKSNEMKDKCGVKTAQVIPNGVDLEVFMPLNKKESLQKLNWPEGRRHILFAASKKRSEKNYQLAENTMNLLNDSNIELHTLENIPHYQIPVYLNAADIILLTSFYEGSPNAIKEAMACNKTIISTDVGDVKYLFGKSNGHFIMSFDKNKAVRTFNEALEFTRTNSDTKGRDRIMELKLDSNSVASKIIDIYKNILMN